MPDSNLPDEHEDAVTRAELIATVERSPAAATAHDRAGWVDLFTADGLVEDPVGSRPHRGPAALTRFYDTFIEPRAITFHRDVDIVVGHTVLRDLELEVSLGAVMLRIPAYLRYDVHTEGDERKIERLQAYWELPAMISTFARSGAAALPAGLALSRGLLANQGVPGAMGFLSGLGGVGAKGKRTVVRLIADAAAGDQVAVRRTVGDGCDVTLGDHTRLSTSELVARLSGASWQKVVAAGDTVAVGIQRDGRRSVLLAGVRTRPSRVVSVRLYTED